ncbi:MAG TPA: ABC transporter substrate-binding protein [Chloroflexota bacterium]|nr:ABC transporter substrate-binding protein [Chloroflexota bacterium]
MSLLRYRALRRPRQRVALWSAVFMLVAACTAPPAAPAASSVAPTAPTGPAAAAPAPPAPVTLNYGITSPLVTYWIDFVGIDKGFFAAEGITLDLVLTEASVRATTTLVGGSVDISNNSPDSTIIAVEKGADLVIVGEAVARPVYSVIARPEITQVAQLRGQKVGVSDLKSGATLILLRTLYHHGLREGDIDPIPAGGTSSRYAALKSGAVAAVAMLQPDDFRAMDEGFNRIAVSTEAVKEYTFNSLVVRRDWARQHADELVRFLRGFRRAVDWLYDPANKEEAIAILAERTRQEEKYARQTYELAVQQERMFAEQARIRPQGLQAVLELLAEVGELQRPLPSPEKYIDTSYWERAQPR